VTQQGQTSLTQNVTPLEAGAHVIGTHFIGPTPVLVLADGQLRLGVGDKAHALSPHKGAPILLSCSSGTGLVTGGEDGKIMALDADGTITEIADNKGRWVDALAAGPAHSLAWSCGKTVYSQDGKGQRRQIDAPSSVRGLGFLPKGYRLAFAHYNGASLWFPNSEAKPEPLEWKGSHLDLTVSPDGRFVVTSMQENTLHGWRLTDKKDMRMSGYPSKVRSLSWSHDGEWLATSGAEAAVIWPFKDKDGPMGKPPRECGVRPAKITQVAFHPKALVLAIGYEDNCILLCRLTDAAELLVRRPVADQGAITSMAWEANGKHLIFGTSEGQAGLLTLP
jgi:WD40 repeat protein